MQQTRIDTPKTTQAAASTRWHQHAQTTTLLSLLITGLLAGCGSGTLPTAPDSNSNSNSVPAALPAIPAENSNEGSEASNTAATAPEAAMPATQATNPESPNPDISNPAGGDAESAADNATSQQSPEMATTDATTAEPAAVALTELQCDASPAAMQQAIVELTNQSRRQAQRCGNTGFAATTNVVADATLALAAQQHSDDMAHNNFFNHTGSDGLSVADRIDNLGFNWFNVGENIAAGQDSLGEAHSGWMQSPGHCENIMNPRYTRIGVACTRSGQSNFERYWTVVFARDAED